MKTVIFDFDKTIITKDSLLPFALYISKSRKQIIRVYIFLFFYLLLKLKLISKYFFKDLFLRIFCNGYSKEELKNLVSKFEIEFVEKNLNREIFNKFKKYITDGYKVIILSSNFDILLENLSLLKGASCIISTETEYLNISKTYKVKNYAEEIEKIKKIEEVFGRELFENGIFYGDKEHKLLLNLFKNSIQV